MNREELDLWFYFSTMVYQSAIVKCLLTMETTMQWYMSKCSGVSKHAMAECLLPMQW